MNVTHCYVLKQEIVLLNKTKAQSFLFVIALMFQGVWNRSLLHMLCSVTSVAMKGMNEPDGLTCSLMGMIENLDDLVGAWENYGQGIICGMSKPFNLKKH